jgi:hypothetical protein
MEFGSLFPSLNGALSPGSIKTSEPLKRRSFPFPLLPHVAMIGRLDFWRVRNEFVVPEGLIEERRGYPGRDPPGVIAGNGLSQGCYHEREPGGIYTASAFAA